MRNFLLISFILLFAVKTHAQTDLEERLRGLWMFERSRTGDPNSGTQSNEPVPQLTLYFKSNNTGNFNFPDRDSEPFTWSVDKNKLTIKYEGKDPVCLTFSNEFKAILRDRKGSLKLDLIKSGLTLSLVRKPDQ